MKRRIRNAASAAAELQRELQDTSQALRRAYDRFNYACEPELVESCVYEINALQARYNYLIRLSRQGADVCAALAPGGGGTCLS